MVNRRNLNRTLQERIDCPRWERGTGTFKIGENSPWASEAARCTRYFGGLGKQ